MNEFPKYLPDIEELTRLIARQQGCRDLAAELVNDALVKLHQELSEKKRVFQDEQQLRSFLLEYARQFSVITED